MPTATAPKAITLKKEEARATLLGWLKPGDTVYTILRHVSASGMTRHITPLIMLPDGPRYLTYNMHVLMGYTRALPDCDALVSRGCGMDMGFDMVYNLSRTLFAGPDYKAPQAAGHTDPGYALNHRWL